MSKWDKLILKISALSKELRFSELRKVLESYGYVMNYPKGGSSHYTFRKKGCMPITIPKHEPIKRVYVEMVRLIVEKEVANFHQQMVHQRSYQNLLLLHRYNSFHQLEGFHSSTSHSMFHEPFLRIQQYHSYRYHGSYTTSYDMQLT
jgi:predicted RNA binding protein YcfA (HicA-like mRNA interferase family)